MTVVKHYEIPNIVETDFDDDLDEKDLEYLECFIKQAQEFDAYYAKITEEN